MNLTLHKTKHNTWKIITTSSTLNPAIIEIAKLVGFNNRIPDSVKIGIYTIGNPAFTNKVRVKSLCSGKSEYMTKKQFHKFMRGEKQILTKKKDIMIPCKNKDEWKKMEEELLS